MTPTTHMDLIEAADKAKDAIETCILAHVNKLFRCPETKVLAERLEDIYVESRNATKALDAKYAELERQRERELSV